MQIDTGGDGPLVLLIHGFPETSSSWRHQMSALATAGYRAVAVDVRGYGDAVRPGGVEDYRMLVNVADAVEAVRSLGRSAAAVVGHDVGSPIASACALIRPDVFTAVGMLGVPWTPRADAPPTSLMPNDFYVRWFQDPGVAEATIEADLAAWLRGFYVALTGEPSPGWSAGPPTLPTGAPLPAWLSQTDFDAIVAEFARNGMTGPLNRYRNFDRDWEDLAAFDGRAIGQPAIFIAGAHDPSVAWMRDAIGLLGEPHLIDGAGHWVQQEAPDEVSNLLIDWLCSL
jgi:pimeloyl-ACP methyl ester carboxylesterase